MWRELVHASGYLFILFPPALLLLGIASEIHSLAVVSLFGIAPLLRIVYGDASTSPPQWRESVATALEWLPNVYGVVFLASMVAGLALLSDTPPVGLQWVWLGLSFWAVFAFASCAAHELLHRRDRGSKVLGRILAGVMGYPVLEHEHRAHHATSGAVRVPEWPAVTESVWRFSARRMVHVLRTAWDGNAAAAQRAGRRYRGGLQLAVASMAATAAAFGVALGWTGVLFYLVVSLGVHWAIQAITYVQHWGLGRDSLPEAAQGSFGWEDGCRLQRWLTLSISYHQAHHHGTSVPYYRQTIQPGSPRMPGGYVVLLFASLVPPVWRALMMPALSAWKLSPHAQQAPGRRLFCIARPPAGDGGLAMAPARSPAASRPGGSRHPADPQA